MKLNQTIATVAGAVAMALAGNAFAQEAAPSDQTPPPSPSEAQPSPPPATGQLAPTPLAEPSPSMQPAFVPEQPAPVQPVTKQWQPGSGFGLALMAGGGVSDFTQSGTRDVTSTGGAWDARLAFGTRSWVGVEASYIGGANTIHNLGVANNNTNLVRNGLEGSLRLNAPLHANNTLLEPYAAAGVGWNSYRVTNYNATLSSASVSNANDNTVSIPLALGFAVGYKGFVADARYTIRPTYNQTVLTNETSSALTNWDFGGMLGYEF